MDVTENEAAADSQRDLQQVDAREWPERPFPDAPGRESGRVPVVIRQSVLNAVHLHGQQHNDVEICGVLVGRGYRDEQGPYLYIQGAIRGDHAESQVAQVTFTSDTWNHIHAIMDNAFPEERILAWYHTHPGFGVFLSGMDLFIQDNFFSAPEQFALVYDPLSGDEGVFVWEQGKTVKTQVLIEPDAEEDPPQRPHAKKSLHAATAGAMSTGAADDDELRRVKSRQSTLLFTLLAFVLFAVVWPWVLLQLVVPPELHQLDARLKRLEHVEEPRPEVRRPETRRPETRRPEVRRPDAVRPVAPPPPVSGEAESADVDAAPMVPPGEPVITMIAQIFARTIGWAILGLFLAIAPGVVLLNMKRLAIGLAGGFIGGFVGGILFDAIAIITPEQDFVEGAFLSRLVAITAIGAIAGLGTGLIELAAKTGWLRVVEGLIAGKQFVIYKNPTYLGSSPQCEIYLFKDPQVSPQHACIHAMPGGYDLEDLQSQTGTRVNGRTISRTRLRNGDRIQIGSTTLLFQEKQRS
jgi:proteasome lid subunit RPN8/RPN11